MLEDRYLTDEQLHSHSRIYREIANEASDHTLKVIVEAIQNNICGSVFIPNSGKRGYDTSHIKIKDDFWQTLKEIAKGGTSTGGG